MVSERTCGMGKRVRETEWFISCGQRYIGRDGSSEEWPEVGGFIATQGHGDVWFWAAAGPVSMFMILM